MRARMIVIALIALLSTAAAVQAAQTLVEVGGVSHGLRTNSPGGQCLVHQLPGGVLEVSCDDGAGNRARANTSIGCLAVAGHGQCFLGSPPVHTNAEEDVSCPNGDTFTITTGNGSGSCSTTFDAGGNASGGGCDDGSGNSSSVDCSKNGNDGSCTGSTGSGKCTCKTCK